MAQGVRSRSFGRVAAWRLVGVFSVSSALAAALFATEPSPLRAGTSPPAQTAPAPNRERVILLEPGNPIERELTGGQVHSYQVTLSQGEYVRVLVEQRGIDVTVKSFGMDGKLIAESDSENRLKGVERAELTAEAAGSYRFDVESKYKMLPAGRYEIRLEELRVATEKDRLLQEARELYTQAFYAIISGKYDEAQFMAEKALGIREKEIGPDHPDIAYTLTLIANIAYYKGDLVRAERLYHRAIAMLEKTLGADHPQVATRLNNLASVYQAKSDLAQSELLHQRALEIREQSLPPDHPDIAQSLNNLANVYSTRGDLQSAEALYLRALAINEKILGPDHLNLSYPLLNLGSVYLDKKDYDKAEPLFQRALAIREQKLGHDHPAVALVLYALSDVFLGRGDYVKAEELEQRALQIRENKLGPDHADVARSLAGLGNIYFAQRDYQKAEPLYRRALAVEDIALGRDHPDTLHTANKLARLYMATGDFAHAVAFQTRAIAGTEHNIDLNLAIGSERQKSAYLASLPEQLNRAISLHVRFAVDDPGARDLAVTTILQRKGRVLDAMSGSFAALRSRMDAQHQALLRQFNDATTQLAKLVLYGPQRMTPAEHQNQIRILEAERENLEIEISRRSAGFYQHSQPIKLASIQSAVGDNGALIELVVYRSFDPQADDAKSYGEPRYIAYVVRNHGEVRWKDLGTAKEIDGALDALRQALRDPQRKDVQQLARAVDEKVMQPVRALLGDATRLLISPDGELNLIPFEALVDEQGRYLVERYSVNYLTSGRDLLRLQVARSSKSGPLVIANPLFGEPTPVVTASADKSKLRPGTSTNLRRSMTGGDNLSTVYFAPLAGTAQEAQSIQSLFPEARVLTGQQATVDNLKQADAPRILHIATHGFFLEDSTRNAAPDANKTGAHGTPAVQANVRIENPLLRSGLALAGANLKKNGHNTGILTALEASTLDLWGTKLVTLSACDTGMGEVKNGEGVYGLRRSFFLAGAESLVMSLWPVSDHVTREMMTAYYTGLKRGLGRGEALRQAELAMLKRKDRQHPFYWASFIQSGEWANLNGQR
jgi:CHAT domain-containing protein/Tfp pilus assembly protein PilF